MFYQNKTVLVAGGTGLMGTHLVQALLKQGARVRSTLHKKPAQIYDQRVEYLSADLTRREDCDRAVRDVDYVFLCAANTSGAAVMAHNPIAHLTPNLLINSQMLEAACLAKVERLLFVSSTTVYPAVPYPVKESEAFVGDPHESYLGVGWMKRYIEKLAQFYYERYGMKIALVRPTNAYGPFDKFDFETSHVLPALIRRALDKQNPFEVWGDGTAVRDFIYISDLTDALLLALEHCANCEAINLGSGQPITIQQAVEVILKLTGHSTAKPVFDASKPTTIPIRLVDLTKARELLNYQPRVSFEEGIKNTIEWYGQKK
ncbi:MAG: NAD-dependent epimerase/dehydratase family protein [Kovacikia sp.]